MQSTSTPAPTAARWQLIALVVVALAFLGRWLLSVVTERPVPGGLILIGGALAVLFVARPRVALPVALGATVIVASQFAYRVQPRILLGASGGPVAAALWIQLVGLTVALVAGVVALVTSARDRRSRATRGSAEPRRTAQIIGLVVLAPICAEYLSAYDDTTGHPLQLVFGLTIFVPLYGCSALLIREVARRFGLGWVGIVLLGLAFGLTQAGVVDQSLFSQDYREIDGWETGYTATLIGPLGISAFNALNFVGGHAIFSMSAPIGLIEATRPATARQPWLSRRGLVVVAAVYLAGSAFVLQDHLMTEADHASTGQVVGSLLVVLGLIGAAFRCGRGHRSHDGRPAPRPAVVFAAIAVVAAAQNFAPENWVGVALTVLTFVIAGLGLAYGTRRTGWDLRHVAAACAAPVVVRAVWAFTYPPLIGEVSDQAKYGHNAVMLTIVLAVTVLALRRREVPETGRVAQRVEA